MEKKQLVTAAKELQKELVKIRRWLHSHAETGFDLPLTKKFVESRLKEFGYSPKPCGRSGIIATVGKGEKFLLRADMDGLPIREQTGKEYAAVNGNMHACGHDMHTAMLLGAAKLLKKYQSELNREIVLMFQPAEEILEGAKDMIEAGVLDGVKGGMMIHVVLSPLDLGTVIVGEGVTSPSADYFEISVQGKGCHGSTPTEGVDAAVITANILLSLEHLIAREVPASDSSVLTVGKLQAGTAGNVIADTGWLEGTLRTYAPKTRKLIKKRIQELASGVAKAYRGQAETKFKGGCPPLENDKKLSKFALENLRELFEKNVYSSAELGGRGSGGSEDFAYVSEKIPSVMLALVAGDSEFPLHHPKVCFEESILWQGAAIFACLALSKK